MNKKQITSLNHFVKIVNGSKNINEAFKIVQKLKNVSPEVSREFRDKYDPENLLTPMKAFEIFYNTVKK